MMMYGGRDAATGAAVCAPAIVGQIVVNPDRRRMGRVRTRRAVLRPCWIDVRIPPFAYSAAIPAASYLLKLSAYAVPIFSSSGSMSIMRAPLLLCSTLARPPH
jgi:hypothetical protein